MENLYNREKHIEKNKNEIEMYYFSNFNNSNEFCENYCLRDQCLNLSRFSSYFKNYAQYTQFRTIASINYADNFLNNSSCIVSAVVFDKKDDFFASAGVLKKIRIYDFNQVIYNYKDLYSNDETENESQYSINQDTSLISCENNRKNKAKEVDDNDEFYSQHISTTSSDRNTYFKQINQNLDGSSSSIPPYMTSLPNKIPLSSILLNPDINNLNNDTIHSNLPPSQHDNISYSSENSYINNNDNSNIDYVTRYPIQEMICNSKISCLSYSNEKQNYLLSSDYEGIITLWDSEVGEAISTFKEHEKRAWCVDYCTKNPTLFASCSDDTTVKIWNENVPYSALTIDSRANICSVAFNPYNEYEVVFGSADHNIYYYDIRNAKSAWKCIKGHKKAISYVKFRNRFEFVSASTDNTLKLWSINPQSIDISSNNINNNNNNNNEMVQLIRSFSGHLNERNFAGLSINKDGDFILCGSETNEIYTYYSESEKPIIVQKFGNMKDNVTGNERDYCDVNQFISSLSWKNTSPNVLLAANSEGCVKVYELI
ncbi:WD40 repeat-like protein [Neocallimastix lanati (nom. inval.)]|nr:WD40 repeat-like protein [Neocallimastix sp. JGI-2020a]